MLYTFYYVLIYDYIFSLYFTQCYKNMDNHLTLVIFTNVRNIPIAESQEQSELKQSLQNMHVSGFEDEDKDALTLILAQKMFTAFHNMSPDQDPSDPSHPSHPLDPSHALDSSDTSNLSESSPSSDSTHASVPSDPSASSAGDEQR